MYSINAPRQRPRMTCDALFARDWGCCDTGAFGFGAISSEKAFRVEAVFDFEGGFSVDVEFSDFACAGYVFGLNVSD